MTEGEFAVVHMEVEREQLRSYREMMIEDIIEWTNGRYVREDLLHMSTRRLEALYDNC